ncbi:MAG: hypothetical protein N2504_02690 [candidate division WOR-3 bacterium]|nr:hypothetical protein [candidate division WOR-3 bacterium]MCX7947481.1 hypothetical protein [candidate division WOR-3 bacterium]MDW8150640.1 hypothetical protein [candidate division WOR-3 bacterium]
MNFTIFVIIISILIWFMLGFYYLFLNPYNEIYSLTIPSVLFTIFFLVSVRRAFITIGINTARGKLTLLLGIGGFLLAIGFFLFQFEAKDYIVYPLLYIGHLSLVSSVVYMFITLLRSGYSLTLEESLQVIGIFIILLIVGYSLLVNNYKFDERFIYNLVLIILGYILAIFAIIDLRIFWGSDLGKRWIVGSISGIIFLLADIFFVVYLSNGRPEFIHASSLLWGISGILMNSIFSLPD